MAGEELEDLDDLTGARVPESEFEPEQQAQGPNIVDRAQDLKDQFDQGKELYTKGKEKLAARSAKKAGAKGAKEGAKKAGQQGLKKGVEQQGVTAAKAGAEKLVQTGAKTAATTATKAGATAATLGAEAATGPVGWVLGALTILSLIGKPLLNLVKKSWKVPVYILAGLLLLLAVPFGLLGLKSGGKITPTTPTQLFQSQALLPYIGGDFVLSGGKINERVYQAEKERYAVVQHNVDTDPTVSGRSAEVKRSIDEILKLIDSGRNLSGGPKKKITADTIAKIQALDSSLPFGTWIAAAARSQVGKPSGNFCTITKAGGRVACASFVSTVLQNAGIPNPIQAGVDGIWRRPFYKTIVDRPNVKSAGYYSQNKSKLQIGDIIFWGDGGCSKGGSVLFDHIGFYVGGDEAVDNSSGGKDGTPPPQIRKRGAASRSSCIVFNGAKRYGSSL